LERIFAAFENWIDPYRDAPGLPPRNAFGFVRHYVAQAKLPFVAMLVLGGLVALVEAALFWFVGRIVDLLAVTDAAAGWDGLLAANGPELLAMLFIVLVVRFVVVSASALVEEQTIAPGFFNLVRWQAYRHVARQSYAFFQNDFAGRIVTKVWSAGQATGDFMVSLLQVIWFTIVYATTTIILIGGLDWRLAVVVVVWLAAFGLLARHFVPRIRRWARETAETASMVNGRLVDNYSNILTLKLFGSENRDDAYVRDGMERFRTAIFSFTRGITGVRASLAATGGVMISAIAILAIDLWLKGQISAGSVAVTLGLVLRLNMLLGRLMTQLNSLLRNYGTIQNSMDLIAQPTQLVDRPAAVAIARAAGAIAFDDVTFHYGKGEGVIAGFSLDIKPGERVGLVGPSGAGKTTLANLVLRLFDVEGGRITLDGRDIRDITQATLRQQFGVVSQEPILMHRSIRDNIAYGNPTASEADIIAAARRANAHSFIETLADHRGRRGFDAHAGERGVKLSGGQRQRIAIARVMLKDAPVLILDEATSALDSEIEAAIQENLFTLMEGKTVIAIAHRLSTIASLNRLVVIDDGGIVETGSHEELVRADGLYASLWSRQSGGFLADADAGSG
jgi:ATP-binding cassette subfamily B multidrug efflux pump